MESPTLSPELQRLLDLSWELYEADYRYLGLTD
jgi:hypothetical protein